MNYMWNFHETGHRKGAPDGIGAACKLSGDQLIAEKGDTTNLYDLVASGKVSKYTKLSYRNASSLG